MKVLILLGMLLTCTSVSFADICSHLPGYSKYGTSCFKLYTSQKTWAAAEASCVADGGHLASIHSSEEQAFVAQLVAGLQDIWIGITVSPNANLWSDNTNMDYDAWQSAEPNDGPGTCGRLWSSYSYLWADRPCSMSCNYICRAEKIADQTQAYFTKIPDGVPMDASVLPASSNMACSATDCAWSCQRDIQCVHFILSEDGGKYLCETYTSLVRPPTATPPTANYMKVV